ncbi:hypothetical protein P7C73_g5101, partial [Tremellales sp. Uapishka_1]
MALDERLSFLSESAPSALPRTVIFTHRAPSASGDVELQYWPAANDSKPPELIILFILGNPGLLNYYHLFLNQLYSLLPPSHAILATSHIGQSPSVSSVPVEPLDLPAHLACKIELVDALNSEFDRTSENGLKTKICLMGHSVGAWLSCEVLKQRPDAVHAGYLLFPTLGWIADSWNGRLMWPIFQRPVRPLLSLVSPLLRPILPFTTFPDTTLSLLRSPSIIKHVLAMAKSEMDVIRAPDTEWFSAQSGKDDSTRGLFGLWAGGSLDGWVGKDGAIVRDALGGEGERVKVLDGVPHAFCMAEEHSTIVAEVVASWVIPRKAAPSETKVERDVSQSALASVIPM